jgi:hypothetical protein
VAVLLVKHPVPLGTIVITTLALLTNPLTVRVLVLMFPAFTGAPPFIV